MSMTGRKNNEPEVEVLSGGAARRRRWTAAEKVAMVPETLERGVSVSLVARRHGVNPNRRRPGARHDARSGRVSFRCD